MVTYTFVCGRLTIRKHGVPKVTIDCTFSVWLPIPYEAYEAK